MRILKAKEKKERALNTNLGLKAHRSNSVKSALLRRGTRPGMHGGKFQKIGSEYKIQLMEKQKVRFSYGLNERQMAKIVKEAIKSKNSTAGEIIKNLERRLDNVVFRLGIAGSRGMARQMVSHGHIYVNDRKVKIPSYKVSVGDKITIKESKKSSPLYKDLSNILKSRTYEDWLIMDANKLEGIIKKIPEDVQTPFDLNLMIDFYSR